ncbi:histidine phosphotransferase ChpT [Antarcticirhabdus aurantiaca]|uniref:Histidine phosphotransferase family protein n=1 Tax=Antarcticirhabdus aurantiaca TaxID=2606717 RepID=A0ACD4NJU2_9HYPH|nr:histidine phosphotransferase family protein [Antarcticirhabdus aurantiaca]WAJ27036.1 histidine phosphotransferase family protein [Jeongeuplla avenae]
MKLPNLAAPDLASLLASRLCHDIISPVFGIQSGLELLDEMPDDAESMALVRKSLKSAVAKLQFSRIAFGASGSTTAQIDLGEAKSVAEGFMDFERANLVWSGERAYVPKNQAKLLLNLLLVANAAIPRGREVSIAVERVDPEPRFVVKAVGKPLRVHARLVRWLNDEVDEEPIDAQAIQPFYTVLLARETGLSVTLSQDEESATFIVEPAPVAASDAVAPA